MIKLKKNQQKKIKKISELICQTLWLKWWGRVRKSNIKRWDWKEKQNLKKF
jgi:hypothetical protein